MKRLTEFLADDSDPNQLDEGLLSSALKTTYVLAQASSAKKNGDEVVRYSNEAIMSWPPKTVPLFVDQGSFEEWHGNVIQMRMR